MAHEMVTMEHPDLTDPGTGRPPARAIVARDAFEAEGGYASKGWVLAEDQPGEDGPEPPPVVDKDGPEPPHVVDETPTPPPFGSGGGTSGTS
jgi:hypothetical protein